MFKKFFSAVLPTDPQVRAAQIHRNVLRDCAKMGGAVFGPVPEGVRREFFCLDENTWVWHEEWSDGNGMPHTRTTRYDVRPHGIFKAQDGQPYQPISYEEAERLTIAAYRYNQKVHEKFDPLLATVAV